MMKRERKTKGKRLLAVALCFALLTGLVSLPTANTVYAVEITEVLDTDVPEPSDDCIFLGVYGSYYNDKMQEGLDLINAIRKEACLEGLKDPYTKKTLTEDDYVPLKWSQELEKIARIRAAESVLGSKLFTSGHGRLNGKDGKNITIDGKKSMAENLAYTPEKMDICAAIEGWYSEKSAWKAGLTGGTGHYENLISTEYKTVGLCDFFYLGDTDALGYPNSMTAIFSSDSQTTEAMLPTAPKNVMQKIEVKAYGDSENSHFQIEYVLGGTATIYTDQTAELMPRVNLTYPINGNTCPVWVVETPIYASSDASIATVAPGGVVTGHKNGETVITASWGDGEDARSVSMTVNVKCGHENTLLSSTDATCKEEGIRKYRCETCGVFEEKFPKIPHNYAYGDADDTGLRTGICAFCQDEIRIHPPTRFSVSWKNTVTGDQNMTSEIFPKANPVGSELWFYVSGMDGDAEYQTMRMTSTDETVISVPETIILDSNWKPNMAKVLSPGIVTLTIYPEYNSSIAKSWTVRVGDSQTEDIAAADVALPQSSKYTGKACEPVPVIYYDNVKLGRDIDYTVAYENNIEPGTARAVITGIGIFKGTIEKEFEIVSESGESGLSQTKAKAMAELQAYADELLKKNEYSSENVSKIKNVILPKAKADMDNAADKAVVDKILKQYKGELDRVEKVVAPPEGEAGTEKNENNAYTLLEEYYNSLINSGKYNEEGKANLTAYYEFARSELDEAETEAQRSAIVEEAKADFAKVSTIAQLEAEQKAKKKATETKVTPAKTSIAGKPKALKKGFTVKWRRQKKNVDGYEVCYSTDRKFRKNTVTKRIKKNKTTKLTVKKLKAKKKYYVKVRTYKVVKGEKLVSAWSGIKTVKTKK